MAISEITLNGKRLSGVCWRDRFKSPGQEQSWVSLFILQRPGPEEVIAMPSLSAIEVIALFTFSCQRQKVLEMPSLPFAGLEFLRQASLEPFTLPLSHQSTSPISLLIPWLGSQSVFQMRREFSKEGFLQVIYKQAGTPPYKSFHLTTEFTGSIIHVPPPSPTGGGVRAMKECLSGRIPF